MTAGGWVRQRTGTSFRWAADGCNLLADVTVGVATGAALSSAREQAVAAPADADHGQCES